MDFGSGAGKAEFWRWLALIKDFRHRVVLREPEWDWRVDRDGQCGKQAIGIAHSGDRVCDSCGLAITYRRPSSAGGGG